MWFCWARLLIAALALTSIAADAFGADGQALFYYVSTDDGWDSLSQHIDKISVLAPQVFIVDKSGQVHGSVEDRVRSLASSHGVELMPLLADENADATHALLADPNRYQQVIDDTLRLCQASGCVGLQIDIEGVVPGDGAGFAAFVRLAAKAFHAQALRLSVAVPSPLFAASAKEKYAAMFGGFAVDARPYPVEQFASDVDFVTLMAYAQYGQGTTPGPVASQQWVEQSVRYMLQFMSSRKLSLGVGLWAQSWCNQQVTYRRYTELQAANAAVLNKPKWDKAHRAPWFEYDANGCHTTVWFENRRSVKEKFKLVNQFKLLGFSAWRLGQEDPDIWNELHARKRPKGNGG